MRGGDNPPSDVGQNGEPGEPGVAAAAEPANPAASSARVRDDYAFSQLDLAQIEALKRRAADLGLPAQKNALLRAGIAALATLSDEQLRAEMGAEVSPKERG